MKTSSAKAKGAGGQKEVRQLLLNASPGLEPEDIRSTSMGSNGVDLLLSPKAFQVYPWVPEVKRRANFTTLYKMLEQHSKVDKGMPIVFLRGDRKPWVVLLNAEDFMDIYMRSLECPTS